MDNDQNLGSLLSVNSGRSSQAPSSSPSLSDATDLGALLRTTPEVAKPRSLEPTKAPTEIRALIDATAERYGLPPELLHRITGAESGYNPNAQNPNSSAGGLFQFIDSTWASMGGRPGRKHVAEDNVDLGGKFTAQNVNRLRSDLGRDPTFGEVYAAHYLGPGVSKMLAGADRNAPIEAGLGMFQSQSSVQQVMAANPNLRGKTVGQVLSSFDQKMGGGTAQGRQQSQGPRLPDPNEAPAWADIEKDPEYAKLSPRDRQQAKAEYFDYWFAPHAGQEGADLRKQFLANAGNPDATLASDVGNLTKMGIDTAALDLRELVGRVPVVGQPFVKGMDYIDRAITGRGSEEILKGNMEQSQAALSPETTAAADKKWWDSEKGTFGPAWSDPRAYMSTVVQSLPEQVLTMGPAMALAKGAYAYKIAAGASEKVAALAAARTAQLAGSVSEGALGGAQSSRQVRDKISTMTPEQLQGSDAINSLMSQGMSFERARDQLANDAATQAFFMAGVTTGIFGGMGDRFMANALTEGVGKNIFARIGGGVVSEGLLEEFPQSYLQQVSENLAMQKADPTIGTTDDALNQAFGGLAAGGIQGGGMATLGHNRQQAPAQALEQPDKGPVITPDGRLDPVDPGPAPHPTTQTADQIVTELAQQHGVPIDTVLPQPPAPTAQAPGAPETAAPESFSDQDVLNFAASRYQALREKQAGKTLTVPGDTGMTDQQVPGTGLSATEKAEFAALNQARDNVAMLRKIYGFDNVGVQSDATLNQNQAQQPAPAAGPVDQPLPGQEFPATTEPGLAAAQSQENSNAQNPIQAQEPGPSPSQDALIANGQPSGPAPLTQPATDAAAAQNNVGNAERIPEQQVQADGAVGRQPTNPVADALTHVRRLLPPFWEIRDQGQTLTLYFEGNPVGDPKLRRPENIEKLLTIANEQEAKQSAQPPAPPRTEKEARAQKDYGDKWFGTAEKAQAFIDKQGIGATHAVVHEGGKHLIKKKESTNGTQATEAVKTKAQGSQAPDTGKLPKVGDILFDKDGIDYRIEGEKIGEVALTKNRDKLSERKVKMNSQEFERLVREDKEYRDGIAAGETPAKPKTEREAIERRNEFVTVKDVYGHTYLVRKSDLDGDRKIIPTFTKAGDKKTSLHRDNIDLTGEKKAAFDAANASNPFFDVVTADQGKTFKTEAAAKAHATKEGYADTHEAVPASSVQPGLEGYLLKRKATKKPVTPQVPNEPGVKYVLPTFATGGAKASDVTAAAHEAATSPHNDLPEPTQAQKEAGNYKKGHVMFDGLDLTIENPVGSERSGTDPNGKAWAVGMMAHYGYLKRTEGADGDQVDVYLAEHPVPGSPVFVFDQYDLGTGKFDEHKAVLGASDLSEATKIYDAHFSDGKGPQRRRAVQAMPVADFKTWAQSADAKKPVVPPRTEREAKALRSLPEPTWWTSKTAAERHWLLSASGIKGTALTRWNSFTPEQQAALNEQWGEKGEKQATSAEDNLYSARAELKQPKTLDELIGAVDAGYRVHFDYAGTSGRTLWIEKSGDRGWVLKSKDDDSSATFTKGGAGMSVWDKHAALKAAEADAEYRFKEWKPIAGELPPLVKAMNDLADVRARIAEQGRVVDDRLLERERQLKAMVKELEANGQNDELDAEMRSYEAKADKQQPKADDFDAMFDQVLKEETAKDQAKQKPKTEKEARARVLKAAEDSGRLQIITVGDKPRTEKEARTAREAAASAAKNTAAGLNAAIDGLGELFGGKGRLSSGLTFDEETYAKAKPLFQQAIANLKDASSDLKEAMRTVIRMVLDKFGAEAAQNMKPYVVRFVEDISKQEQNSDASHTGQPNEPGSNQGPSEANSGQRGNNQPGSGQADQEGMANPAPADVGPPSATGDNGRSGTGAASGDVGSDRQVRKGRNAANGRKGTSGTRVSTDGAGEGSAGNQPDVSLRSNYHIADPDQLIGGTPKVRFARNKKAIEALQSITSEGREPTQDELDAMAAYIGWGSFGQELFKGTFDRPQQKDGWATEDAWLREHLGREAWNSAQASIINAHYTDPITVGAMWDMVRQLGFNGGRVLEPSMGVGNFFGLMPRDLMERSKLAGIEMDTTTGGMAKILYPDANIQIKPYQDSKTADDFYDLVIGNWPFAKDGPVDRRYLKLSPSLHDYFFLKALDQTRPGGLVVGITSAGTMDKKGTLTRAALADKADLVAAYRLPSGAFEKYAGTAVVTDIIILKKRASPNPDIKGSGWISTAEVATPAGEPVTVNEYFAAHPDHVLGTLNFGSGTTYGRPAMIVDRPADLEPRLRGLAATLPAGTYEKQTTKAKTIQYVTNNTKDREQSITEKDGQLYQVHGEYLAPLSDVTSYKLTDPAKTAAREQQLKDLIGLRRSYGELIDSEREGTDGTEEKRTALRQAYESFTKKHGSINKSDGLKILKRVGDPFYPSLAALETPDGKPAAIMSRPTIRAKRRLDKPSVRDALVLARNESVDIDIDRVAQLAGVAPEQAAEELVKANAVFKTPAGGYEVSDVYLSGNVRRKLREAEAAQEQGIDMQHNIAALKEVLPKDIPYYNIEAKLGATWIRPEQYKEFISHLLGIKESPKIEVRWAVNRWKVKFHDAGLSSRPEATTTLGHYGVRFDLLLTAAMGNTAVRVTYKDRDGNTQTDEQATAEANEKAQKIREEFANWLWNDPVRKIELERTFNDTMNAIALPKYDGSFLTLEGMALQRGDSPFNLRQHQVDAIWRGLANGRSINAHEVGTGKTYTMGGLAVESRRYGMAKKPLIFAHNANSASVAREIGEMYPGAKLLYVDNLSPDRVGVTLRQIANDDWDAIVVPHSLIDRFTLKRETLMEISRDQIEALEQEAIDAAQEEGNGPSLSVSDMDDPDAMKKIRSATAKQLVHARNAIIKKIDEMAAKSSKEDAISFEDMGVDMVIVDEAHEFKKPPIATRMRMKGLNTATSGQSISLMFLTDYVKKLNGGSGVHLFTGTPITNTMTEIYNMMRYVMDDQMSRDGIRDWDAWFNTFADSTNDVELTASGEYEPITRLASFVNVAELRRMIGQYMDIVFADDMPEFKPRETDSGKTLSSPNLTDAERNQLLNGRSEAPVGRPYKKVVTDTAEMTPEQKTILATLQQRANIFKNASKKERREMMLSGSKNSPVIVETDAANAGLDARLYDLAAHDNPGSKVNRAVTRIIEHYNEHPAATQVVFVERGFTDESVSRKKDKTTGQTIVTKKPRFNLVKDLVQKLEAQGVKKSEIAIVDGGTSKENRKAVADAMNRSEIRVVIGNTQTLGVGVNMQANLRAMHHLDAPWMPGELEQRNGRGHRQGNKWNTVMEYRYLTERIDGRRWQVLTVKDRFIKAFLKAKDDVRVIDGDAVSMDEEGDIGSTLSEAASDPRLLLMNKIRADVAKLENKERMHAQAIYDATHKVRDLTHSIEQLTKSVERYQKDDERFRSVVKGDLSVEVNGKTYTDPEAANEAIGKQIALKVQPDRETVEIASVWGFTINAFWPSRMSDVQYSITSGGTEYPMGKATIESARATLYGLKDRIANMQQRIADANTSIPRMQEAIKAPFARADELKKKIDMLAALEADIQANPIPAPAWLRNGAPVNSEAVVNGKPAVIEGHRWTDNGYMVTITQGNETKDVDYLEVKDANGLPMYEVHPFEAPKVEKAEGKNEKAGPAVMSVADGDPVPADKQLSVSTLTQIVKNYLSQFGHKPEVVILDSWTNLGATHAQNGGVASGMVRDGKIYLFRDGITDTADAVRTLWHELLHYGLRRFMTKEQYIAAMAKLYRDDPYVRDFADSWLKTKEAEQAKKQGMAYARARGVDEALASLAEHNQGGYVNNDLMAKARRAVLRWVAAIAEKFGFHEAAAKYRSVGREDPRALIRDMFGKLKEDAPAVSSDPAFTVDPSFLIRKVQRNILNFWGNQDEKLKTFGAYDKTLSTQFNKALKDKHFGKVFGYVNAMQNEVSLTSIRPAELAPALLPRIDNIKAAVKTMVMGKRHNKELQSAAHALFAGTVAGKSVHDGKVWTDEQLRSNFGLSDEGIGLYRQGRAAVDASLDEVAAAEAYAMAQGIIPKATRQQIIRNPQVAETIIMDELGKQQKMLRQAIRAAEAMAEPQAKIDDFKSALSALNETETNVGRIFAQAKTLQKAGYLPLMRFGKYSVLVQPIDPVTGNIMRDESGKSMTEYYAQYETESEAIEARKQLETVYDADQFRVTAGTKSQRGHELYAGISPETLALFAQAVGADAVTQKYYEAALSERSALKRRLHRKNIVGFSDDLPRVLSNFITSNGRFAAQRYYLRDLNNAIDFIPDAKGDVKDEAQALKKFILDPSDAAAPVSSLMFAWFLGGSVASAAVNLTQPVLMTAPYLSQFGVSTATAAMAKAMPIALGRKQISDQALRDALKRAGQEGIVDAQEIFHLYSLGAQGVASGAVGALSRLPVVGQHLKAGSEDMRARINGFLTIWGSMFAAAEGFNRRLTFVAAWEVAKANAHKNPYAFAVRAVNETQGIYNKVNRPNWARGPVGRVVLTFKQYSLMYIELLSRMWKKGGPEGKRAALIMLAVLLLAAGEEGLPFAQDFDDFIDTIGQAFGLDTNMRRLKRRTAYNILGKALGDLFLYGISAHLPLDFSGRLGLGNLIPGSSILKPSSEKNRTRDVAEVFGPAAGLLSQVADAYDAATEGEYGKALENLAPSAVKNAIAGAKMIEKGYGTDFKGRKTVETTPAEGTWKIVGFNPTVNAQKTRFEMPEKQDQALQRKTEASIADQWAQAAADNDRDGMARAQKRLDDWNKANPETPIQINASQIMTRARKLMMDSQQRLTKSAPRELRGRPGLDSLK